ncbi:hypothetical protein [Streptomyces sp. NPDC052693]|uniref:hypothetical protein n=1 Tax=Streptomyces sp. NPDC052693 TaxID=3155814 RepID=UPI003430B801
MTYLARDRSPNMIRRKTSTVTLTALAAATTLASAPSASAGGIGDFLSPAFGTNCTNHHGARAEGTTTHGTGTANGNLAGLPLGGALNQCGGADLVDPAAHFVVLGPSGG